MDVLESKGEATNSDLGKKVKGAGEATEAADYCNGVQGTVPRESSRHASNDGEDRQ